MPNVVVLDIAKFRATFPGRFPNPLYTDEMLMLYFDLACNFISNTECSIIPNPPRETILYLTMAHLLTLDRIGTDGTSVGRVSSAKQGSVSATFDYPTTPNNAWWVQTQYGTRVWELTRQTRSFRWVSL